ncbi:MAG: efflux RND transporter periplasmic adaptor subunit [Verrucomicrobia bacterium]|nr:efflux RND transporter periplasmic adaptor subunit [Verrucomicrobiota bacterium]
MKRTKIIAGVILLAVVGLLVGIKAMQIGKLIKMGKSFVLPPETISSAVAHEEVWRDSIPAVASVIAAQGVTLTPEIPGTVSEIAFESGAVVAKGDLLVKFDTSQEEAQLRALEAQVEWWRISAVRARQLLANQAMSQAEVDDAEATLKTGEANADAIRTTIAKKTIRAPFAGRTGIRMVNLGEYVDKARPIVSLQSLGALYAEFSLPQQELSRLKTGLEVRLTTDAFPEKEFSGTLTTINPDLDATMRSVRLQATFANAEQLLRPGMFARVELILPETVAVLAVPATAILSAPYGDSVYVIENSTNATGGLVVRQQLVRVGRGKGDFVSVTGGLKPGERVVASGLFKLRNGMSVVINDALTPKSEKKPHPSDS